MCTFAEWRDFKGREYLFCKRTDRICDYSKFCRLQNKFILNDRWEQCSVKEEKNIPSGSNRVLFERKGFLYIDYGNGTIKVKNIFTYVPDYIYIRDGIDGYDISLKPFQIKKKATNTNKKK